MMKTFALTVLLLLAVSAPALACLEPPEVVRAREIALLDAGLKRSKLEPREIAKAKELRNRAEALFEAGKLDQARDERHAALVQIGYRYEEPEPSSALAPGSVPVTALAPKSAAPKAQTAAPAQDALATGCGESGGWVAPTQ
jgi:hypothetical protein